jgi:hypothetical protein
MPLRPGKWIKLKMIDDKDQPSFLTYKVLAEEGEAQWIEVVMEQYTGRTVQKMLVHFGDRSDIKQIEIKQAAIRDANCRVHEMPPQMMSMMQLLYRNALSALVLEWKGMPQEVATAPAGRFTGCYKMKSKAQWSPWKSEAVTWAHPKVPINGLVKCHGTDKKFEMELVAFGETGAKSDF